ncbi:MAG: hypothetical protein IPM86_10075 [Saprospiraceae bacterium]|nr:hypothetical protein [Saprospiraceae bacterium]
MLETNDRILLVGSTCKSQTQTLPCIFELDKNGRLISKKTFTNPVLGLPSDFSKIIRSKDGNIICTSVKLQMLEIIFIPSSFPNSDPT